MKQASEVTRSKLAAHLKTPECRLTLLTPIEDVKNKRMKIQLRCECGQTVWKRVGDILYAKQIECPSCACKRRGLNTSERDKARLRQMAAAAKGTHKVDPQFQKLRRTCQCAKARCTNPNDSNYKNYGARGITFGFESASAMARWVIDNLGYPSEGQSFDRIDNDKGYEPGNLRLADKFTQANNKREYKRTEQGERIRKLQAIRPDFCYERIREFIKEGLSDDDIINRKRTTSGRPRVRH